MTHFTAMIRIDRVWLAAYPLGMLAWPDTVLARIAQVFASAPPSAAYH